MNTSIVHATAAQLASGQAKITYLGVQTKPIASVVFHAEGFNLSMDDFIEVQPTPTPYPNDTLPYTRVFTVMPAELRRMLLAVEPVITAEDAGRESEFLSFTVVREERSRVTGSEYRIGPEAAPTFYRALLDALDPGNTAGRAAIEMQFAAVCPPSD